MAKRKRLGPADALSTDALEVKGALKRAPIASVAGDAAVTAALAEVSSVLESARIERRLLATLPLGQIEAEHLIRDRIVLDDDDMTALKDSIANRGQQAPIEVVELAPGSYGLISGWRRMAACLALAEEGRGHPTVLARVIDPISLADAYVAMVEENEIRVGLSYYERARIVARSVQAEVYPNTRKALRGLFANVSRAKRSKIGSFVVVAEGLDGYLLFPTAIGERLGLQLAKLLEDPYWIGRMRISMHGQYKDSASEQAAMMKVIEHANRKIEPKKAKSAKNLTEVYGLTLRGSLESGPLTLDGPALTPTVRQALQDWLADTVHS